MTTREQREMRRLRRRVEDLEGALTIISIWAKMGAPIFDRMNVLETCERHLAKAKGKA